MYYVKNNNNPTEVEIKHRIDEIYTEVPFYWYRKITEQLKREGLIVNHKRVLKYMREMQIKAIYPGPNLMGALPIYMFSVNLYFHFFQSHLMKNKKHKKKYLVKSIYKYLKT